MRASSAVPGETMVTDPLLALRFQQLMDESPATLHAAGAQVSPFAFTLANLAMLPAVLLFQFLQKLGRYGRLRSPRLRRQQTETTQTSWAAEMKDELATLVERDPLK